MAIDNQCTIAWLVKRPCKQNIRCKSWNAIMPSITNRSKRIVRDIALAFLINPTFSGYLSNRGECMLLTDFVCVYAPFALGMMM